MRTMPKFWAIALVCCFGCSGSKTAEKKADDDILDRKVDSAIADEILEEAAATRIKTPTTAAEIQRLELPPTPEDPSREIDGIGSDWKGVKSRSYTKKKYIESGASYWRGANDASFKVSVDSDEGFMYMLIEVRDDQVLAEVDGEVSDGVVLTLRDPNLDAFVNVLPDGSKIQDTVKTETQLLFLPDGQYRRFDDDAPLPDDLGIVAVESTKRGYTVELALQIEAFEQVSAIPLYDVAFRVEVLDGDEKDRPGTQTVISMFPDRDNDDPRLALTDIGGALPHYPVAKIPPRKNAIGAWRVSEEKTWEFMSFEAIPKYWATIEDRQAFEDAIKKIDAFDEICKRSKREVQLIEAYQSRGGGQRVGLVLCGDRVRGSGKKARCAPGSRTEVIWVMMKPDGDGWAITRAENVFGKKLPQCAWKPVNEQPFVNRLSLFPVDMQDANMWAVGWTQRTESYKLREDVNGITLIQGTRRNPVIGSVLTQEMRSNPEARSRMSAKVYLTPVDDDEHFDFCQIENVVEQYCQGVDRGCQTFEHGKTVLTTVQLYNPKIKKFERYEMTKHKGCNSDFDFARREGYILMQTRGRVGFLPSPITQAANSDDLDIF